MLTLAVLLASAPGDRVAAQSAPQAQALLAQGRSALRAGDRFTALRLIAQARELQPQDEDIRRALADVLAELGAYEGAARALGSPGDAGLRSRRAAERLRWGATVDAPEPARRFEATDAGIAQLQELLSEAQRSSPPDEGLVLRLERDLVAGLRQRERWADAVAAAQALRAGGAAIPPWVRLAEAEALLALRRPEEAREAFDEVLRSDPNERQARIGRFWAELDLEDYAAAFATADALAAEGGPTKRIGRMPAPQRDYDWLDAQLLAARARRFADMPAEAWKRVEPLAREAPASSALRHELGDTAAARGWPRRAHEELLIARTLVTDDPWLELALADSELRRREWNAAQERLDRVAALYPGNSRVARLQADLAIARMPEFEFSLAPRKERGDSGLAPGDGLSLRARAYSAPLAERWRLLAEAGRETAKPREDELVRNRYGAGVEGRWPDLTMELVAWNNTGLVTHPGASALLQWQPDDHWTLGTQVEAFSQETPLLALQAGIRADRLALSAVHAWDESRVASASVQALDFTDGNQRLAIAADYAAVIVDRPGTDVLLRPGLYASRNTRTDAPYFNPKRDASLSLSLDVQDRIWRRYECSLVQRIVLSLAPYWQEGFGTHLAASASYEQGFAPDARSEWRYGVSLSRRYYDGDPEVALVLFLRWRQRF